MNKDKKYLLDCAENAAEFINERGSGSFISLLLDVVEASGNKFENENRAKQYFCQVIYDNKGFKVDKLLGGGNALSQSFKAFIENFLQISKTKEGYIIKNKTFNDLTMEELKYVLGWTGRLIKKESGNKHKKANHGNKNRFDRKRSTSSNNKNQEPFNDVMAAKLGKLKLEKLFQNDK